MLFLLETDGDMSAKEGASVTLNSSIAEIGDDVFIQWLFMAKNKRCDCL